MLLVKSRSLTYTFLLNHHVFGHGVMRAPNPSASLKNSHQGPVAQWLEQSAHNRLVTGSSPVRPTI